MASETLGIASAVREIKSSAEPIATILAASKKTSITRLTKDQIFQFPIVINGEIDSDEIFPIIKSVEKNYASLVLTAIVNEGYVDRDKYRSTNDFLRKFHTNGNLFGVDEGRSTVFAGESWKDIQVDEAIITEGNLSKNDLKDLWDITSEQLDTQSLNDMYRPHEVTLAKLSNALEAKATLPRDVYAQVIANLKDAPELGDDLANMINFELGKYNHPSVKKEMKKLFNADPDRREAQAQRAFQAAQAKRQHERSKEIEDYRAGLREEENKKNYERSKELAKTNAEYSKELAKTNAEYSKELAKTNAEYNKELAKMRNRGTYTNTLLTDRLARQRDQINMTNRALSSGDGDIMKDEKFNSLTPTLLKIKIANIKENAGTPWTQTLMVGVRAMPRLLSSDLMVGAMKQALQQRAFFKFLKLTKGELSVTDFFLGYSEARIAVANSNNKWLETLRRRSIRNNVTRLVGFKYAPNTTIIITSSDAHRIFTELGVNVENVRTIKKMMDKYFILGFGIYDTEAKMLKMIYDADTDYSTFSLRTLVAETKKDINLLAMNKY